MNCRKERKILNEKGQAIFEFIVFVPFYVYLLTVLMSFGNSLNATINQNKVLRGYYYRVASNYSRLPIRQDLNALAGKGRDIVGMGAVGYNERMEDSSEASFAACVKVQRYIGSDAGNETCEEPVEGEKQTRFIRIFTAYGVCGESWQSDEKNFYGRNYFNLSSSSCVVL